MPYLSFWYIAYLTAFSIRLWKPWCILIFFWCQFMTDYILTFVSFTNIIPVITLLSHWGVIVSILNGRCVSYLWYNIFLNFFINSYTISHFSMNYTMRHIMRIYGVYTSNFLPWWEVAGAHNPATRATAIHCSILPIIIVVMEKNRINLISKV